MLPLLNLILPAVISLYKQLRDASPGDPALTDDQIIELLGTHSEAIVDKANAWLDSHPGV